MDLAEYLVHLRNRRESGTSSTIEEDGRPHRVAPTEGKVELEEYDLGGVDCAECGNTGMIPYIDESGELRSRHCACMKKRVALRRAARGKELGLNYAETWSCYKGGEKHCGRCGTCVERKEALAFAGIDDPTEYLSE